MDRVDAGRPYPGTPRHQALLQAIVAYYSGDARVRAVALFGSLARGDWDTFSDLDLDVVIADGVEIDVADELERLSTSWMAIGERAALIIPDGDDAGDIVLESLLELSIRYHPLRVTHPNIVESLQMLAGETTDDAVREAGLANRRIAKDSPARLLDKAVRYAVEIDVALQRRHIWLAIELLHRTRHLFMELFARTHGGTRPEHYFQAQADAALQARLGDTLAQYSLRSVRQALLQLLDLMECDLGRLADDQVHLTDAHRLILARVHRRQAQFSDEPALRAERPI